VRRLPTTVFATLAKAGILPMPPGLKPVPDARRAAGSAFLVTPPWLMFILRIPWADRVIRQFCK
jgi:hypothetical protein